MKSLASERWKLLRRSVLRSRRNIVDNVVIDPSCSVRRFSSFGLFDVTEETSNTSFKSANRCQDNTDSWIRYTTKIHKVVSTTPGDHVHVSVGVKTLSENPSLEALVGFNNTGNVCIWPSEEVMAYYCLKHVETFRGLKVCELGGGMTSLCGLLLASTLLPSKVILTDGNQKCVDNIQEIIAANDLLSVNVSAEVLVWDESFLNNASVLDSSFDYVLCADCLFFTQIHVDLTRVILKLLKLHGEALLFAPRRNGTLERFCGIASEYFDVQTITKYDDTVWLKHQESVQVMGGNYSADLHYPVMILLKKKGVNNHHLIIK